jgi:hypothetical protein
MLPIKNLQAVIQRAKADRDVSPSEATEIAASATEGGVTSEERRLIQELIDQGRDPSIVTSMGCDIEACPELPTFELKPGEVRMSRAAREILEDVI